MDSFAAFHLENYFSKRISLHFCNEIKVDVLINTMTYIDEEVRSVIELYIILYIVAYMCICIKLAEDLEVNPALQDYPEQMTVYTWPELD